MRSATILLSPLKVNNLLLVSIINIFSSFIFVIDSIFHSTLSIIVTSKWHLLLNRMRIWLVIMRSWIRSLPGLATFFRGHSSWNIFYSHSLPSAYSRRAVVCFWWKNVHKYWSLRGLSLLRKFWLGKLNTHNMTLMGWLGHETSTQSVSHLSASICAVCPKSLTKYLGALYDTSTFLNINQFYFNHSSI